MKGLDRRNFLYLTVFGAMGGLTSSIKLFSQNRVLKDSTQIVYGDSTQKVSQILLPEGATIDQFNRDLSLWVDMKKYDRIKYEFLSSGRLLSFNTNKSSAPPTYTYHFANDYEFYAFEQKLIEEKVFKTEKRLELGYQAREIHYLKNKVT